MTSTGSGKRPRVCDEFGGVGDDDEAAGGAFDDLLAEECSAAAFDEGQAGADFIGAVDGEVELRALVEGGDGNGERLGELLAGSRGCDAADAQPLLYALAELPG